MKGTDQIILHCDEHLLRKLLRRAIRKWGAMNRYEEQVIEDEFIRLIRAPARRADIIVCDRVEG